MRKRVKILFGILFVALVGVIVWQLARPREREPVYMGRRLSSWLVEDVPMDSQFPNLHWIPPTFNGLKPAMAAGTNAIPTLLRLLRERDSVLKVKLMKLLRRQEILNIEYTSATQWNQAAVEGFEFLGYRAQDAAPALVEIADENISPSSRLCAIQALGLIGPPAKEAVPSLLRWVTNTDADVRNTAKYSLLRIDPEAADKAGIK